MLKYNCVKNIGMKCDYFEKNIVFWTKQYGSFISSFKIVLSASFFYVNTVFQFAMLFSIKVDLFWATSTILAHSKIHDWAACHMHSDNLFMPWIN